MKEYETRKRVKAAKIIGTRNDTHGSGDVNALLLDDGGLFHVRAGWWKAKEAAIGGYLVVYQDGYASFSPAAPFEQSATLIQNAEPALSLENAKAIVDTKTAPRVTLDGIKAAIDTVDYLRHDTLTICVLTMRNSFKVVGKAAPADARNFDYQVGQRFAYDDAFKQLWPLMGFALCEQLHHIHQLRDLPNKDRLALFAQDTRRDPATDERAPTPLEAAIAANAPADPEREKATAAEANSDEPDQAA
jgi:hypothetical protein